MGLKRWLVNLVRPRPPVELNPGLIGKHPALGMGFGDQEPHALQHVTDPHTGEAWVSVGGKWAPLGPDGTVRQDRKPLTGAELADRLGVMRPVIDLPEAGIFSPPGRQVAQQAIDDAPRCPGCGALVHEWGDCGINPQLNFYRQAAKELDDESGHGAGFGTDDYLRDRMGIPLPHSVSVRNQGELAARKAAAWTEYANGLRARATEPMDGDPALMGSDPTTWRVDETWDIGVSAPYATASKDGEHWVVNCITWAKVARFSTREEAEASASTKNNTLALEYEVGGKFPWHRDGSIVGRGVVASTVFPAPVIPHDPDTGEPIRRYDARQFPIKGTWGVWDHNAQGWAGKIDGYAHKKGAVAAARTLQAGLDDFRAKLT